MPTTAKAAEAIQKPKTSRATPATTAAKPAGVPGSAKPAKVKTAGTAKTTRAAASAKPSRAKARATGVSVAQDKRRCYVEVAAYYIAERRGFSGGGELDDWIQAEAEVDRLLSEGILQA